MTHNLVERYPLVASLKYRCECENNEVVVIQVVLDADTTEENFVWTMRRLWRDVHIEIEQHTGRKE